MHTRFYVRILVCTWMDIHLLMHACMGTSANGMGWRAPSSANGALGRRQLAAGGTRPCHRRYVRDDDGACLYEHSLSGRGVASERAREVVAWSRIRTCKSGPVAAPCWPLPPSDGTPKRATGLPAPAPSSGCGALMADGTPTPVTSLLVPYLTSASPSLQWPAQVVATLARQVPSVASRVITDHHHPTPSVDACYLLVPYLPTYPPQPPPPQHQHQQPYESASQPAAVLGGAHHHQHRPRHHARSSAQTRVREVWEDDCAASPAATDPGSGPLWPP